MRPLIFDRLKQANALILLIFIVFFTLLSPTVWANKKGIGLSFGNPTGLAGKYWMDENTAVDVSLGFSLGRNTDFSLHSDYLWHKASAFFFQEVHPLDLYYGIGGRMEFAEDIELGIRVPVGVSHHFEDQNAEVFFETAPVFEIITKNGLELHVLFGARYYF